MTWRSNLWEHQIQNEICLNIHKLLVFKKLRTPHTDLNLAYICIQCQVIGRFSVFCPLRDIVGFYCSLVVNPMWLQWNHFEKQHPTNNSRMSKYLYQIFRDYSPPIQCILGLYFCLIRNRILPPGSHVEKWCLTNKWRTPWDILLNSKWELRYYISIWMGDTINAQLKV